MHWPRLTLGAAAIWLLALAAAVAAAVSWAAFAHRVANAVPVPHVDVPQPNAVVWRGRVYQSRAGLARDLKVRGKSYRVWAQQHPDAAALLASLALRHSGRR